MALLFDHLGDNAGADGVTALTDRELEARLHGDGTDQLGGDADVIAGHHHLDPLRQLDHAGDVGGSEVELRSVPLEERRVAAAFFLDRKSVV